MVFITAYNDYAREAYRVGACAYLSKAYVTEELNTVLDRLQKLLQIHRSSDMLEVSSKKSIVMKTSGDFYKLIEGDREIASQYNDKYMDQYSWGELTVPWIEKRVESLTSSN